MQTKSVPMNRSFQVYSHCTAHTSLNRDRDIKTERERGKWGSGESELPELGRTQANKPKLQTVNAKSIVNKPEKRPTTSTHRFYTLAIFDKQRYLAKL